MVIGINSICLTSDFCRSFFLLLIRLKRCKEDKTIKDFQINNQIRDKEIRVIDSDGTQLGIMSSLDALRLAEDRGLDLVKISPQAVPPVCKIIDYGKFKFEMVKKEKEIKKNQKIVTVKEVWLSATIDTNDLKVKAKSAEKFLKSGDKVKVSIRLKGRQMAHSDIAMGVMTDFFEIVKDFGVMEKQPLQEGKNITMILASLEKK